jgi:hypothetical protein
MRKTSSYALKRANQAAHFNGAEWLNAIGRCRPYSDEPIIGSWLPQGTTQISNNVLVEARMAYQVIKDGTLAADQTDQFDMLAHVTGVAKIRAIEIAGDDPEINSMLPMLYLAEDALRRLKARWERLSVWGFDGPGITEIAEALDVYEAILTSSSPQQMADATDVRIAILKQMHAENGAAA